MSMDHKPRRPKRFCPEAIEASDLLRAFLERSARGRDLTLAELWRHWDTVLGRGLASLALPVGHREATLLVAAEDHLVMQELSFMTPEILERVNAFLEEERFQEVHLSLLGRQRPLNAPPSTPNSTPMPRRSACDVVKGRPLKRISPSLGWWTPLMRFATVDFPLPLSPTKPKTEPCGMAKSTSRTACSQ